MATLHRFSLSTICAVLLCACDGGILGSGHGGGEPKPDVIDLEAIGLYVNETLPAQLVPDSTFELSRRDLNLDQSFDTQPLRDLSSTLYAIEEKLAEITVNSIIIDAAWSELLEYCLNQASDNCVIEAGFTSLTYTAEMGAREYHVRKQLIEAGDQFASNSPSIDDIRTSIVDRIGSIVNTPALSLTLPGPSSNTVSVSRPARGENVLGISLQWNTDSSTYLTRYNLNSESALQHLAIRYISSSEDNTEILYSFLSPENETELELALQQAPDDSVLDLTASHRTTADELTREFHSTIRSSDNSVFSYTEVIDINSAGETRQVIREYHSAADQEVDIRTCSTAELQAACEEIPRWTDVVQNPELNDSEVVFSVSAVEDIAQTTTQNSIFFEGIDNTPGDFALLAGDSVFVDESGNLYLSHENGSTLACELDSSGQCIRIDPGYSGLLLCRITKWTRGSNQRTRHYCAAQIDDIQNATVIRERKQGRTVEIELLPFASVTVTD